MAVFGHLKGPGISFVWDEQKDGSLASDYKLDDSYAVLNIETRLQLKFFLAGEVEGVLEARAELLEEAFPLDLSTPFLFFCDLAVGIGYYFAGLFEHVYQRLIHGEGSSWVIMTGRERFALLHKRGIPGDALFQHANSAAAYELLDVVDEEAVGGDHDVVGFENGAELAGLFEVEHEFAFAWSLVAVEVRIPASA